MKPKKPNNFNKTTRKAHDDLPKEEKRGGYRKDAGRKREKVELNLGAKCLRNILFVARVQGTTVERLLTKQIKGHYLDEEINREIEKALAAKKKEKDARAAKRSPKKI